MMDYKVHYISGIYTYKTPIKHLGIRLRDKRGIVFDKLGHKKHIVQWEAILAASAEHQIASGGISKGGAIAGGVLFGPAGAVLGGLKGGSGSAVSILRILIKNPDNTTTEAVCITRSAEHIKEKINQELRKRFSDRPYFPQPYARPTQPLSNVDNEALEKLAELQQKGVITQEEFTAKKKQLLEI